MATLTVQKITRSGLTPAFQAADAGLTEKFANDGQTFFEGKNTNAATRDVTFLSQIAAANAPPGTAPANVVVTLPITTGDKMIGPFPPAGFNDSAGYVNLTLSASAGVTLGAFSIAP